MTIRINLDIMMAKRKMRKATLVDSTEEKRVRRMLGL